MHENQTSPPERSKQNLPGRQRRSSHAPSLCASAACPLTLSCLLTLLCFLTLLTSLINIIRLTTWTGRRAHAHWCAFEKVIDSSRLCSNITVVVSRQIAHGTVHTLQLLHILRQPACHQASTNPLVPILFLCMLSPFQPTDCQELAIQAVTSRTFMRKNQ